MFSTNNFCKLNTPKTYIITTVSGIAIYLAPRVSIKLSVLTGLSLYLYKILSSADGKKKCCGGKNKSKTGKCCSGGDGSCCSKENKPAKKKGCCGGNSCSKKSGANVDSKEDKEGFDDISTDFTAQFAKKGK